MWHLFSSRERVKRLEREENVDELAVLVRTCQTGTRLRQDVEAALERLSYRCVFHEAQGHMETTVEEYGPYYCAASDANSNCHAGCMDGSMCTRSTRQVDTWVIDVPARVDIIKK